MTTYSYSNICMYCGKKSMNFLKYRVFSGHLKRTLNIFQSDFRDFCSTKCLCKYWLVVLKQEGHKGEKTA